MSRRFLVILLLGVLLIEMPMSFTGISNQKEKQPRSHAYHHSKLPLQSARHLYSSAQLSEPSPFFEMQLSFFARPMQLEKNINGVAIRSADIAGIFQPPKVNSLPI